MARTLITVKNQIKLSLDDITLKPNVHNHNEVQVFIKDEFVGYGANVSELKHESKIRYADERSPIHKTGVFRVEVLGPTLQDSMEGALYLTEDDKAYLLDINTQKHLGLVGSILNLKGFWKEFIIGALLIVPSFYAIYYRDVVAVQKEQLQQCIPIPVK